MKIRGLYLNDKIKHILAFSAISLVLSWLIGPILSVVLSLVFSVSKGIHDWEEDIAHSLNFLRIRTIRIPMEFLLDQGSDIIGIAIGVILWIFAFRTSLFLDIL